MQVNYTDSDCSYNAELEELLNSSDSSLGSVPINPNDPRLDELKEKAAALVDMSDDSKCLSFSKKIMIAGLTISLLMSIACVVLRVLYNQDITDIMTITIAAFGMDSAYGGFYFWKEKNANRAKYAQQFVLLFADTYGVDAAVRIAEVVLRD